MFLLAALFVLSEKKVDCFDNESNFICRFEIRRFKCIIQSCLSDLNKVEEN